MTTILETASLTAASVHRPFVPPGRVIEADAVKGLPPEPEAWIDPGTDQVYPLSYYAYRRTREAEEKTPARHRTLGPDVEHYIWQRGFSAAAPEAEVSLTVRPDAPPRVRRMVAEVLRSIRRGRPASDAIRRVSRRFGLAQTRARAFLTASIDFEIRPRNDAIAYFAAAQRSSTSFM
jgi:hypothetical protein